GAVCLSENQATAAELPAYFIEGKGDEFLLTEVNYAAGDSFVYTATANFSYGQAAGLVFGGDDGEKNYWVFNVDRRENRVKLMYFSKNEEGDAAAKVLAEDWFVGNDKMTDGEKSLVFPKVETVEKVQLKAVISAEADGVHGEFYADGIRRFGIDDDILLSAAADSGKEAIGSGAEISYEGGKIGYNCFNSAVTFTDGYYGASDYSYYTEAYRQQYHFSQYAHWNNDPNGLVYYNGWYHLYYQHHPYSNYWGDMYWGHARSKDLAHWELLPICLFPDTEADGFGGGNGYMWSGSAMVYRKGTSAAVDGKNWFENGGGNGLIAFYTRDGVLQDQVIMTSDDEGLTWTKRVRIPQTVATQGISNKTSCRDPKVFPVESENGKTTRWGMALTGMETDDVWFLQSTDLLNWSYAGGFKAYRPECPDVVRLTADDKREISVMTFSGRRYLTGEIVYDSSTEKILFKTLSGADVSTLAKENIPFQTMDFGVDSYATQTFYIDEKNSAYYNKTVSVSWFSGVPNAEESIDSGALAALRKTWNGGGMTIPVEWGLKKSGDGYVLTQTPIVKESAAFERVNLIKLTNERLSAQSENALSGVRGRNLEIALTVQNPDEADFAVRVNVGKNEYTEFGWTKQTGYYADRSHAYDGGLTMNNYHRK
ncbi:MAG: glycoside hydrolase family 32 protein, partial [Candidatus Scatosoma sp.]